MQNVDTTLDYYTTHSTRFIAETQYLDLETLYARFLKYLPVGARLLDAGCGSGRDSKAFNEKGYAVVAIDKCPEFVAHTAHYAQVPAQIMDLKNLTFADPFDGIWACASLLHLPPNTLVTVFQGLQVVLKPTGFLYASFKKGDFSGCRNGRWFTDLSLDKLRGLLAQRSTLTVVEHWETPDRRPERAQELWLNVILKP
jgi:SAM-dependent methyltransferase